MLPHARRARPPAGTQSWHCSSQLRAWKLLDGSCPTPGRQGSESGLVWRCELGTGFLMCSGISSSSKLMTSANQTDVSATAAPHLWAPLPEGNLRITEFRFRKSSVASLCSLLNYAPCHGRSSRKGHDHYKVIRGPNGRRHLPMDMKGCSLAPWLPAC